MHVSQMLAESARDSSPSFSFEYFPPKTAQGVQNLYDRMDGMNRFGPKFIDITWGAGGRVAELTNEIVSRTQTVFGLETCMHLTCTDMGREKVSEALRRAYQAGCTNILALRGDAPRDRQDWDPDTDDFRYAKDLVRYIRDNYAGHFDVGVAGYPEGSDDNKDEELLLDHLKEKVDMGAGFIVTQMFYDADNFNRWVAKVRERGITVPILPGIMPIATYASFLRRANHMGCKIPPAWLEALEPVKNDDVAVRERGTMLVAEMCRKILAAGDIHHLHFYTMNLAQATRMVLEELSWLPSAERPLKNPSLPWKKSLGLHRRDEDVRPVFWRNRNKSYVLRTQDWDEFPNGRWGDSRSPAFGELDAYGIGLTGTNEQNRKKWGEPQSVADVADLFVKYLENKIASLPWSEAPLANEADPIRDDLLDLNRRGLLTVNSQPAVDGVKSSHPIHGWGPANGYVYQKSYIELLVHPDVYPELIARVGDHPDMTYYSTSMHGELKTNAPDGPNAVTWGVFPGKEIVQPTIVESISFLAWKDEAFRLGMDWARCYDAGSTSRAVINEIMETWHLVNIVNNNFHETKSLFEIFHGLRVKDMDKKPVTVSIQPASPNKSAAPDSAAVKAPVSEAGTTSEAIPHKEAAQA